MLTIARRADPVFNDETTINYIRTVARKIYELCKSLGLPFSGDLVHTFEESNFGRIDNRIVLIDYGSPGLLELVERAPERVLKVFLDAQPPRL